MGHEASRVPPTACCGIQPRPSRSPPTPPFAGVAKTILVRLLVGLVGYGAVCAWFPFMPEQIWFLLGAVVALGLFSGIAFSASYQLVARFANKNVIALGLGCSASGPLVLAMQLALHMGATPTRQQQVSWRCFAAHSACINEARGGAGAAVGMG